MLRHRATIETTLRQFAPAESDARQALQLLLKQSETRGILAIQDKRI